MRKVPTSNDRPRRVRHAGLRYYEERSARGWAAAVSRLSRWMEPWWLSPTMGMHIRKPCANSIARISDHAKVWRAVRISMVTSLEETHARLKARAAREAIRTRSALLFLNLHGIHWRARKK